VYCSSLICEQLQVQRSAALLELFVLLLLSDDGTITWILESYSGEINIFSNPKSWFLHDLCSCFKTAASFISAMTFCFLHFLLELFY